MNSIIFGIATLVAIHSGTFIKSPSTAKKVAITKDVAAVRNIDDEILKDQTKIQAETKKANEAAGGVYNIKLANDATKISNSYYFQNLRKRHAPYEYEKEFYTAAQILFNYYDTFWSDKFIPEEYDIVAVEDATDNGPDGLTRDDFFQSPGSKDTYRDYLINEHDNVLGYASVMNTGSNSMESFAYNEKPFLKHIFEKTTSDYTYICCDNNYSDMINNNCIKQIKKAIDADVPILIEFDEITGVAINKKPSNIMVLLSHTTMIMFGSTI